MKQVIQYFKTMFMRRYPHCNTKCQ